MEEDLTAALLADPALTALVGDRIRWGQLARGDQGPAVILHLIAEPADYHMGGRTNLRHAVVQFDCRAETFASAKAIRDAVLAVIDGLTQPPWRGAFVQMLRGSTPEAALQASGAPNIFTTSLDCRVWWKPA